MGGVEGERKKKVEKEHFDTICKEITQETRLSFLDAHILSEVEKGGREGAPTLKNRRPLGAGWGRSRTASKAGAALSLRTHKVGGKCRKMRHHLTKLRDGYRFP